jgi:hypothetical protein
MQPATRANLVPRFENLCPVNVVILRPGVEPKGAAPERQADLLHAEVFHDSERLQRAIFDRTAGSGLANLGGKRHSRALVQA